MMLGRVVRQKAKSIEYHGNHQRLRIAIYADGVARLCYKPLLWRSIHHAETKNVWRWVGDFTPDVARHIATVFHGVIDAHADDRGMKRP